MSHYYVSLGVSRTEFNPRPQLDVHKYSVKNVVVEMSDPPTTKEVAEVLNRAYLEEREVDNLSPKSVVTAIGIITWNRINPGA